MEIGIGVPNGVVGTDGGVLPYTAIRAAALAAERHGFDSVWVYDHLIFHFPDKEREGIWEGWTILSGLAEATRRVKLGTFVVCTAFRNPALLAKMAVTLDEVSGQRLILGLGAGWHTPEFTMFGLPTDHLVDRFEEALRIITPLVRTGRVDFHGQYSAATDCELLPGPQRPIPVMIGASKPRMMRLAARYGDSWNAVAIDWGVGLEPRLIALREAAEAVGRDPASLGITVSINVRFPDLLGAGAEEVDPARVVIGSAEAIAERLRDLAAQGVGHVITWLAPLNDEALARYAEAVALARQ